MASRPEIAAVWRFGAFEVEARTGELRRNGLAIKLQEQPARLLLYLLQHSGELVTREDLRQHLWPSDTFVDFDHALNTAVMKLREALGDSTEKPLYIQTLPRKGYRFVAPVSPAPYLNGTVGNAVPPVSMVPALPVSTSQSNGWSSETPPVEDAEDYPSRREQPGSIPGSRTSRLVLYAVGVAAVLLVAGILLLQRTRIRTGPVQRTLTRITFDEGLQFGATWSPDGRFLAYSSDRGGDFQIWVQQVSGGDPVQVTRGPGPNWQPEWSPDGKLIAYRSEAGAGGIFIVPALGGTGLERKVVEFGYNPHWSPDSTRLLFQAAAESGLSRFYVAALDGTPPGEVQAAFAKSPDGMVSAAWHPDGKRISIWTVDTDLVPIFWTVPIGGGAGVKSEMSPAMTKELGAQWRQGELIAWTVDTRFAWAPSGTAVYFEHTSRGARNLWRMTVNPRTLRVTGLERLTTGPGQDTEPALSPDGKRLAFTEQVQHVRIWALPFATNTGRVTGPPRGMTSAGIDAWMPNLSRDGTRLAFAADRAGRWELWEKSLGDGKAAPISIDDYSRSNGVWSPDGKRLAYVRRRISTGEEQVVLWSAESRSEEPITQTINTGSICEVYDWSPDGKAVLLGNSKGPRWSELQLLPLAAAPYAEKAARSLISDPAYLLFQGHYSPDGEWIAFEAVKEQPTGLDSTLYVRRVAGGPWTRITDGQHWADKPRWSPDGKTIYYISGDGGFLNAWGVRFDSIRGKPLGEPFPVTHLRSPSLMMPNYIVGAEISVTQNRLVLPLAQVSGSIWVLDNVNR